MIFRNKFTWLQCSYSLAVSYFDKKGIMTGRDFLEMILLDWK